jgi:hypothetical protein
MKARNIFVTSLKSDFVGDLNYFLKGSSYVRLWNRGASRSGTRQSGGVGDFCIFEVTRT